MNIFFQKIGHYTNHLKDAAPRILSPLQEKIIAIAVIIFSCIVAGYVLYRNYCFQAKNIEEDLVVDNNKKDQELPVKISVDKDKVIDDDIPHLSPVQSPVKVDKDKVADDDISYLSPVQSPVKVAPAQSLQVTQLSYQMTNEIDENAFNKYLFSSPKLLKQNKALLENTVCKRNDSVISIDYHYITPPEAGLEQLLHETASKVTTSKITCVPGWFDYTEANHFYIDFAHATQFGGAYMSFGCVQEERMFAEFPDLAILDFKTQNGIHPCVDSYINGGHKKYPPVAKPSPFIIEGIPRQFDISKTPYGLAFQKADPQTIIDNIVKIENPVPVNIIGLAAVDWRGVNNPKYKIEDLIYHFEAAYLANCGAKMLSDQRGWKECVVHTAPWGCGAFLNSEKMITAIQCLAAKRAGTGLVFHGVGNPLNPHYTQGDVDAIMKLISEYIDEGKSDHEILTILLNKCDTDATWAPKSKVKG